MMKALFSTIDDDTYYGNNLQMLKMHYLRKELDLYKKKGLLEDSERLLKMFEADDDEMRNLGAAILCKLREDGEL